MKGGKKDIAATIAQKQFCSLDSIKLWPPSTNYFPCVYDFNK